MDIEELTNWSGWRPEDKRWIANIIVCSRTIADISIQEHILNVILKVKQQKIEAAKQGGNEGSGLVGYE